MPTYQYRCADCGNEFETFQKFSEDPLTVCPVCNGTIRRVLHAPGIVFKGSGWYINDSRKSSSESSSSSKDDGGSASKSDGDSSAKPAPPAEKKSSETKAKEPAGTG